ncbi:phosphoglycerate kinase [Halobacteriales archaeon QH_8_67_27]|nr:MAG: phosphoglycerate kinase [Halobacteriales archaeon QH_8_67_27]
MPAFKTLDDLADGDRVLVRLDLNSPVEDGTVQDNRRFDRHAETVRELADRDCAVALMAHQGRPGRDTFVSLEQHADILSDHVEHAGATDGSDRRTSERAESASYPIRFVPDAFGDRAISAIRDLDSGEVLLLENTRMCDEELPEEDPAVKAETEPLALPAYAGRVMETEYEANTAIAEREFEGPVRMIVGGTKATDVIDVMTALGDAVDDFLLGGIAGELFLRADDVPVGRDLEGMDLFDEQWADNEETIEHLLDDRRDQIRLALDLAYEDEDGERDEIEVADVEEKDRAFLDVGSNTVEEYAALVENSEAVFVKGALGLFEDERFADGTVGVLEAIADTDCFSVVGGGDTSRAIEMYGMDESDFGHVSIAGGAYIRALTGERLVGVEVLQND